AAAIAGPGPFPLRRLAKSGIAPLLLRRALRCFLGGQAGEVIPVLVVLGGVGLAEIPALAAVRSLRRGPIAGVGATLAVTQAHLRRGAALVAIGAPAGESPVVRSLLLGHRAYLVSPRASFERSKWIHAKTRRTRRQG